MWSDAKRYVSECYELGAEFCPLRQVSRNRRFAFKSQQLNKLFLFPPVRSWIEDYVYKRDCSVVSVAFTKIIRIGGFERTFALYVKPRVMPKSTTNQASSPATHVGKPHCRQYL
jgi:hypothetical protein